MALVPPICTTFSPPNVTTRTLIDSAGTIWTLECTLVRTQRRGTPGDASPSPPTSGYTYDFTSNEGDHRRILHTKPEESLTDRELEALVARAERA